MEIYPQLGRFFVLPIIDIGFGSTFTKNLNFFEKSQWWTKEELSEYQRRQLKSLIEHAYEKVPHYRKVMKSLNLTPADIRNAEDLKKLPMLNKEDIKQNPQEFLSKEFQKFRPITQSTSGSTGIPFSYYIDRDRWSSLTAIHYRNLETGGFKFGQRKVTLGGSTIMPSSKPTLKSKIWKYMERNMALNCTILSASIFEEHIKKINKYKPVMIRGYPSILESFTDYIMENNVEIHQPKVIYTVAEKLTDVQRENIRNTFSCDVFEGYGGSDIGIFTIECEKHKRHVCTDTAVMEIINDEGLDAKNGEMGEIVTTVFNNYSQIFIRYSTKDMGIHTNETCTCGRGYPLVKEIIGRILDILKFENGVIISAPSMAHYLRAITDIKQYQIIQVEGNSIIMKIVKSRGYKDSTTKKVYEILKKCCGEGIEIDIEFVDEIPTTSAGKRRYIISKAND